MRFFTRFIVFTFLSGIVLVGLIGFEFYQQYGTLDLRHIRQRAAAEIAESMGNLQALNLVRIQASLKAFAKHCHRFPRNDEGLMVLQTRAAIPQDCPQWGKASVVFKLPSPPPTALAATVSENLSDQWRRPFVYENRGQNYQVGTLGRDRAPGGQGPDQDILFEKSTDLYALPGFEVLRAKKLERVEFNKDLYFNKINRAISAFTIYCERFPTTQEGLRVVLESEAAKSECLPWREPGSQIGLEELPERTFGYPVYYRQNNDTYIVYSYGRDKKPGGSGQDADWRLEPELKDRNRVAAHQSTASQAASASSPPTVANGATASALANALATSAVNAGLRVPADQAGTASMAASVSNRCIVKWANGKTYEVTQNEGSNCQRICHEASLLLPQVQLTCFKGTQALEVPRRSLQAIVPGAGSCGLWNASGQLISLTQGLVLKLNCEKFCRDKIKLLGQTPAQPYCTWHGQPLAVQTTP